VEFSVVRTFSSFYIAVDITWLLVYAGILLYFRKSQALLVGLAMGVVLFAIDYGVYYRILGTRHITGADPFWFLSWFSLSYGITMFAWIWLLLDRDGHAVEWSLLPIGGWLAVAQLDDSFGHRFTQITTQRGVGYHGVMAALMLAGYAVLVVYNLRHPQRKVNLLWLVAIGIGVQFAWEAVLVISGIRPPLWQPIVVNSLIETNSGIPILWFVHRLITRKR
jgi:hypothetical protein